jgi:uncharacterized protein (TIGR02217 family)
MTTPPAFPTLPGQGWSVHKKPNWSTIVASHVSGREVRYANYQYPLWEFEATFDGLGSDSVSYPGLTAQSLQNLMGLFLQSQGQFGTFLYTDPTDNSVVGQIFATGNGSTTSFALTRTLGGFVEPVGWVTSVSQVTVGGVPQGSGWSIVSPNTLTFTTAPASGAPIGASFSYAFECRFDNDSLDFEQFAQNLWKLESLKFQSVRTS